jgi:hypothetical protein
MKVTKIIIEGWESYKNKVANLLLTPENEKMMQLQLAQIYQTLGPVYEYEASESIKVLLEVPVNIRGTVARIIDIVIAHTRKSETSYYPIELKCFRLLTRSGGGKRGAQNLGMYDYWEDIENIEGYSKLPDYRQAFQFTLTDDPYYVTTQHKGVQVAVYSTNAARTAITGNLSQAIANREGSIKLAGTYSMAGWQRLGEFHFIGQQSP